MLSLQKILKKLKPIEINRKKSNGIVIHIYSDASLEDDGLWVGGIIMIKDQEGNYTPKAFMLQIVEVPKWLTEAKPIHIGILEAIAYDLSQRLFTPWIPDDAFVVAHVDNQGDVYSIVKGSSNCVVTHAIVIDSLSYVDVYQRQTYVAWINTARNPADNLTRLQKLQALLQAFPDTMMMKSSEKNIPWKAYEKRFKMLMSMGLREKKKKKKKQRRESDNWLQSLTSCCRSKRSKQGE